MIIIIIVIITNNTFSCNYQSPAGGTVTLHTRRMYGRFSGSQEEELIINKSSHRRRGLLTQSKISLLLKIDEAEILLAGE